MRAVLLIPLAVFAGCNESAPEAPKPVQHGEAAPSGIPNNPSPDATFARFRSAMNAKNYQVAFAELTPESQDLILGTLLIAGLDRDATPEAKQEHALIWSKHGIGNKKTSDQDTDRLRTRLSGISDRAACFAEIAAWREKNSPFEGSSALEFIKRYSSAELSDVKIDGVRASGSIKPAATRWQGSKTLQFQQVEGAWRIDFSDQQRDISRMERSRAETK